MLSYLKVENLAVVEKVGLDFSPHLNILTGETGAGKSILIDAIMLLLNKKTPADIIRGGKEKLTVEALFCRGDEETVLRREVTQKQVPDLSRRRARSPSPRSGKKPRRC